ncbi:MAG: adenylyl-sulfate kinase, partial [Candidatus Marinimicrobia bacterium]|nr:adenylyl-sulfate kinase [Candidatus Neomarinimicrobiota bacterium]
FLISLLGIKHVVLAVNKMDLVGYQKEIFDKICEDYKAFLTRLTIPDVHFIPLSALKGDNVVNPSENMPWYKGQPLLELLETIHVASDRNFVDLRYPVQYVLRPEHNFRGFSARIAGGIIRKGDEVMVLPSRKTSKVRKIVTYDGELDYAFPPQSVTVTLKDEIDISRGDMLVHPNNQPRAERHFEAMLVWMDEKKMDPKTNFLIKQTTNLTKARIDEIRYKIDVNTMHRSKARHFKLNEIGRVVITASKPLFFDAYERNHETGSFILIDPVTHNTSAVGMIIDRVSAEELPNRISETDREKIARGQSLVSTAEREEKYQQKGQTVWITGLHGSGKRDVAYQLEKRLFDLGYVTVLLDGQSVRSGLSRELDFSAPDRAEHLRRVAEVCRLLNEQGLITICTFISPAESIREQIAGIIGRDRFRLVYMDASVEESRRNKPELYELAEKGKIQFMAGVDRPYEVPEHPDLILKPGQKDVETIIRLIQSK